MPPWKWFLSNLININYHKNENQFVPIEVRSMAVWDREESKTKQIVEGASLKGTYLCQNLEVYKCVHFIVCLLYFNKDTKKDTKYFTCWNITYKIKLTLKN